MSPSLEQVRLFALTDQHAYPSCILEAELLCEQARPGTLAVTLRDRELSFRERLVCAERLRQVTSEFGQRFFVSDRVDLACMVAADGVHLPAAGLAPAHCRRLFSGHIFRAGHYLETLTDADWAELDGVFVSPASAERKGRPALGVLGFSEARSAIIARAPQARVFALGGVDAKNATTWLETGASGVAAIGAVWDPKKRSALLSALGIRRHP